MLNFDPILHAALVQSSKIFRLRATARAERPGGYWNASQQVYQHLTNLKDQTIMKDQKPR